MTAKQRDSYIRETLFSKDLFKKKKKLGRRMKKKRQDSLLVKSLGAEHIDFYSLAAQ